MKGAAFALLCALAVASAELNKNGCPINPSADVLIPHDDCNRFYQCLDGELYDRKCASNLVFNVEKQECDWPENVDCENRIPLAPVSSEEAAPEDSGNGNDDPSLAPEICAAEDSDGILVAHEQCNKFYQCHNGVPVSFSCAPVGLVFNPSTGACDWPENVECGNRVPGGNGDGGHGGAGNGDGDNNSSSNSSENSSDNDSGDGGNNSSSNSSEDDDSGNGNGNDDPSLAGEICAAEGSEGVLVAHETCNKFYICNNGVPVAQNCAPVGLVFNPSTGACDWPENVDCGNRVPGGDGDGGHGGSGNGDGDNNSSSNSSEDGGDNENGDGGNNSSSNSSEDGDSGNGNGNDDPSLAGEICAAEGSEGVLVAHETCNKFYICNNGVPVAQNCAPVGLVFNPSTGACDWPENVDCGNRVPGGDGDGGHGGSGNGDGDNNSSSNSSEDGGDNENGDGGNNSSSNSSEDGDSGNGNGNDDPSLAGEICAAEGSEGVLVAHETCNKFYICNNGVPVAQNCAPVGLVFNPSTGACDWPENVDCGNRVPGGDGDGGHGGSGNGDGDNNSSSNSSEDGGDNENGDGGNNSSSNSSEDGDSGNGNGNDDPSLAGEICAAEGSEGVLVAHETCNKFYICNNGVPVAQNCAPVGLVFNPSTGACDWPENVDCGKRVPGGDGGNGDGANGDAGNGNSGNGEESNSSENDGGNEDSDNGNNGGGGNANPGEAAEICAADGSDGVLVAHENCNEFYKCSEGKPVVLECQQGLLFNPSNDQCDWPENVNCGNRNPDDGNVDNGNGNSGNEVGDNGNNGGGGNNNPSAAAEICAADGSDGVLVAHENCNEFYKCSEGKPVVLECQQGLLFNPSNDQCDWPENVNCGNRNPDDGNVDNGNGNSGNEVGGNGNNGGGGNNNPSAAAEICAADGSDGVLVAHENCNEFYKCSEGKPVVLECQQGLLFNPSNDQCDWPENVNCGDRNPDDGNVDNGNGNSGNEVGDNGNNGGGGNNNPSAAAEICAADGSDGVLVAHENCNEFYKCSEGKPVVLECQQGLLFNPSNDQCDWPENVNCGDRNPDEGNVDNGNGNSGNEVGDNGNNGGGGNNNPSAAAEICAADDSDGVLVAHENCNEFYKCSEGKPVVLECQQGLLFNPSNDQCDWPENVDCDRNAAGGNDSGDGNSNEDNNGNDNANVGGNSDPSLASKICAADDSDSVLVAHENCNQFYVCQDGLPVAIDCPLSLVFNPVTNECDWPSEVDCGTRYSYTSFNKHLRNIIEQFRV